MTHANEFIPQAVEYLAGEKNKKRSDKYANVVNNHVADALTDFCRQDGEFAQAVVQTKDFEGCLKAAVKGASATGGLSDLTVYGQAVAFYFPGAKISFNMTIDLIGDAAVPEKPKKSRLSLSLEDVL